MNTKKKFISSFFSFFKKYFLLFVLPIAFVLFEINKHPHLISFSNARESIIYSVFTLLLLYIIPKYKYDHFRSILISVWLGIFFLWYRNIINTLMNIPGLRFIDNAPASIGIFTFLSFILIYLLKKISTESIHKIYKYVSNFLILFLFANVFMWLSQITLKSRPFLKVDEMNFKLVDSKKKPDVYFILLDEYCGFKSMKYYHNFDNTSFENKLKNLSFFVASSSCSNYNRTWLTCPSLLEMNYFKNLKSKDLSTDRIYLLAKNEIYDNNVFSFFKSIGYTTINNSFFNINSDFSNERIIINIEKNILIKKTLIEYSKSSFLNHIPSDFIQSLFDTKMSEYYRYNMSALNYFKSTVTLNTITPKFSYSHFFMPHPPLLFANNKQRNFRETYLTDDHEESSRYVDYVKYVNNVALELINLILKNNKNSIIILASDHGHRLINNFEFDFNNFFAVYTPNKNYKGFSDSINSVNIFRTLLNNQFEQNLPILKSKKYNVLKNNTED